jgi:hypothetical protein
MAIRREQPGAAKAAAKAGLTIGKGKRAEEDRARVEREQARAQQRAAQQAAMEWEATKMRMRSEQDFQQELSEKQWDYEKFNRAKAWDIEKMEIASRNDFQQEEQDRSEKMAKTAAGLKAIDESNNIYATPEDKEKAKEEFKFKQEQGFYPPRQLQSKQNILSLLGGKETPTTETVKGIEIVINPITKEPVYIPEGQAFVTVQHPTLGLKKIRREQLQEALAEGSIYIPNTTQGVSKPRKPIIGINEETFGLHRGLYGGF